MVREIFTGTAATKDPFLVGSVCFPHTFFGSLPLVAVSVLYIVVSVSCMLL